MSICGTAYRRGSNPATGSSPPPWVARCGVARVYADGGGFFVDSSKDEYIAKLSPEQLACRGGRHDWPMNHLRLNRALPRGMKAVPIPETYGVWQMEETCPVCGTGRIWTTGRGHSFRSDTVFRYVYPDNWLRIPRDAGVTSRDCLAANIDLCSGILFGKD